MAYADFQFYTEQFYGNAIEEKDFSRLATRASSFLDYYTMGKARKNEGLHELKMACCAIAEQYQTIDAAQKIAVDSMSSSGNKKSETVGSYSVSYTTGDESAKSALSIADNANAALAQAARMYLTGTGLLYRGGRNVCPTCCNCL